MIRIQTQTGTKYDLVVQSVNYTFNEVPIADISAGTPEYTEEKEVEDMKKVTQRLVVQFGKITWIPFPPQ